MFTGIVQGVGLICLNSEGVLVVDPGTVPYGEAWALGESIAVNGCCLTVVDASEGLRFELSAETILRTTLGDLKPGRAVNLERAMRMGDRLGGHLVQGHVDEKGAIAAIGVEGNASVFSFAVHPDNGRYLIDKGSVCIDGISLTVVSPSKGRFDVWVIPHTLENTSLREVEVGQAVNIEFDMFAKYVDAHLRRNS